MKTKPAEGQESPQKPAGKSAANPTDRPEVDFTKEWSNGHKFFTTPEQRAYSELLRTEERTRTNYDSVREKLTKPRNPLYGEVTPRDHRNNVVMNPRLLHTVKGGLPLFDRANSPTREYRPNRTAEKIGIQQGKYDVLGNTCAEGIAVSETGDQFDLYKTVKMQHEKKVQEHKEQEKINEYVLKEKAKRYEKELGRQMLMLQRKFEDKNKEMLVLHSTFKG
jgi:hypothetical protein